MPSEKLIFVATLKKNLLKVLKIKDVEVKIYRSKGLLAHLLNRKHFIAAKYFDYIKDIIESLDYIGGNQTKIEFVKCFKDNIFLSVKIDTSKGLYYVSTMFDIKLSKIDSYCKSGRLHKLDKPIKTS